MQIESLYFKGLNHFLTNNVEEIHYTPQSPFQIIIGTNGSGKTSLIRELSPLPAKHQDFAKGGKKEFICTKDGNRFRLVSDFTNGNEHFFYINDGKNLNEGKKITVQKQLVAQYFNGYDEDIHELLIDEEFTLFTNMSNAERRKWFTRLNTSDMTYALRFYSEIRNKLRDTNGALQHLKKRLTEEQNKFNALESIDGLDQVIVEIKKEIIVLLELKDIGNNLSSTESFSRIERGLERSLMKSNELRQIDLKSFRDIIFEYNLSDINDLNKLKEKVIVDISVLENTTQLHLKELEGMGRNLASINDAKQGKMEKLNEKREFLKKSIAEHKHLLKRFLTIPNANTLYSHSVNNVIPTLKNIIIEFNVEEDDNFTKEGIIEIRKKMESCTQYINQLRTTITSLELRKKHIQETCDVECPQCNNQFKPGIDDNELETIGKNTIITEERLEEALKLLEDITVKYNRSEAFLTQWRAFKTLVDSNNQHKDLWELINNLQTKIYMKTVTLPIVNDWEDDIYTSYLIANFEEELKTLEEIMGSQTNTGELYDELLSNRANVLDLEIQTLQDNILEKKKVLQSLEDCIRVNDKIESIKRDLKTIFTDFINGHKTYTTSLSNDYINQRLVSLNSDLVDLENKLHEKEKYSNTINLINNDLETLEKVQIGLKTILSELSPTDGLIADYLSDNIGRVIETMNLTIEDVWTYRLKVLPCGIESGDLNYEFPFLVKESENSIPDVKRGSRAQKEIVNFSFKLAVMWFLGLEKFPLFLDEFSASFDYQHRNNALNYVKNLIYNHDFNQVFYISQYASTHDSFINADICVTDPNNVVVPTNYNQVISFK